MGRSFILLEANHQLGGRISTVTIEDALKQDQVECNYPWLEKVKREPVEVGATWICEDNTAMLELCKKYKIDLFPQYYEGRNVFCLSEN